MLIWFIFISSVSSAAAPITSDFDGQTVKAVSITIPDNIPDRQDWQTRARHLIPLKPGRPYASDLMLNTIEILQSSGLFETIHVEDPIKTPNGLLLNFVLSPFKRIQDIRISGAFPVFTKEILNIMTIYTGDAFSPSRLDDQAPRIKAFLEQEGYLDPVVTLAASPSSDNRHVVINIHIDKNRFIKIRRIIFTGNQQIPELQLRLKTKTATPWAILTLNRRLIQQNLDKDVRALTQFYRKKGFADVTVQAETVKNTADGTADIIFTIQEGPLYQIVFNNNQAVDNATLKKDIALFTRGNANQFGIKKTIQNIKKRYREKGYPQVQIQQQITQENDPPVKHVTLEINEGMQQIISAITISGHHALEESEIRKQILSDASGLWTTPGYSAEKLEQDINAITALYQDHGYADITITKQVEIMPASPEDPPQKQAVQIHLDIDEGPCTRINTIQFKGLETITPDAAAALISMKPGQPFRRHVLASDETAIKTAVSEAGYPHVQVAAQVTFNPEKTLADLIFNIEQGPYVTVGQFLFAGNFRTDPMVLQAEMEIEPDEPFSLAKLLKSRQSLMNINALDSARIQPLGLKQKLPEVDLLMEVEEKKPYFVEIGAGYDTGRHAYGSAAIGDHNFLGQNLDLEAHTEISQIGYKTAFTLLNPRFLSTRLSASTKLSAEKTEAFNTDFGTRIYSASQEFSRGFSDNRLTLSLGSGYQLHDQYPTREDPNETIDLQQFSTRNVLSLTPRIVLRTTDSYVQPTTGTLCEFSTNLSKGLNNHLDDLIQYRADLRYYYTPFTPVTFAVRGKYGIIQPYGQNSSVPEDQLFFLGGTSSVRGFDENLLRFDATGDALGGRRFALASLEARYATESNWELTLFFDTGSIQQTDLPNRSESFRSSVGVGIRYMTPIGPIGLLYGWKLDPLPSESPGSFHFSMGYTF